MRVAIQKKLNETSIDCGNFKADDVLVSGETYFGYQINNNFVDTDMESTYEMKTNIIGDVTRLENTKENTLMIVDNAVQEIINKLKELGFRTTYEDVSLENGIRKVQITGNTVSQDNLIIGGN